MARRAERATQMDRLFELLDRLDSDPTVVISVRQPAALREAVKVAVALGLRWYGSLRRTEGAIDPPLSEDPLSGGARAL